MSKAQIYLADSRLMPEVTDEGVALVVTSPPYYAIKDYDVEGQIGYGQSLHEYLRDLYRVWRECYRVLLPGSRLCVNIGDQFARATQFGRYKVIPLHAEIISQAEQIGFDYLGAIIWQKRTTLKTSGGAVIMGSYPHPPNGVVELDYEYILLFKKLGKREIAREQREAAAMTKEEWKTFFSGHWTFGGARQGEHGAVFPVELPRRLIRMFTVHDEVVLDPFLGSGTTAQVALKLGRRAIGYEINPDFLPLIEERLADAGISEDEVTVLRRMETPVVPIAHEYTPGIQDIRPLQAVPLRQRELYRVAEIVDAQTVRLADGRAISLLGLRVPPENESAACAYLEEFVNGKHVSLRAPLPDAPDAAYVYLQNRIFINRKMLEMGLALPDTALEHPQSQRFQRAAAAKTGRR
ncbi:MAG TPA: site-specific DNA-methyltransferase [Thermoflexia bacterium]|nr:site-specific DNA-methyltransferase [Thermoflexia bacterium]